MNDKEKLEALCVSVYGTKPQHVAALPSAGGDRRYYRLSGLPGSSLLGVIADSSADARAFVSLTGLFRTHGVNVPEVPACADDFSAYLVQDLGDTSLFSMLGSPQAETMVRETMRQLVRMQTIPPEQWESAVAYRPFSRRQVMWDLNYFKYEYLKNAPAEFDEERLEDDFERLADLMMRVPDGMCGFMMRDCQSRNVMVCDGKPWFIDFQGGRRGPVIYDVVSFLWQARAGFAPEFRREMLEAYAAEFAAVRNVDPSELLALVPRFVLFRTLQVLGAYGFRGLVQKRAHFIESIPGALKNLADLVADGTLADYPELCRVARQLVADPRFAATGGDGRLHVKVFSFSYKKGYPEDLSGNGGGFMFDCRGMHNPGRYAEYRNLTGLDQPVIDFLKDCGEIDTFVDRAVTLVSPTVERYIKRGFVSLQIGFGCTGGRHRSVYSAEAVARMLAERFPEAVVELCHREQKIERTL